MRLILEICGRWGKYAAAWKICGEFWKNAVAAGNMRWLFPEIPAGIFQRLHVIYFPEMTGNNLRFTRKNPENPKKRC
jgi:hypothetical protein